MFAQIDSDGRIIRLMPGYFSGFKQDLESVDPSKISDTQEDYLATLDSEITELTEADINLFLYKRDKIKKVKQYIEDKLWSKVELKTGYWFKFSERFKDEVPRVIEYIDKGILSEGEFFYFASANSDQEIYKPNWTKIELEEIELVGLQHYTYWTNIRKRIVSQIQSASSNSEIGQILVDNGIGGGVWSF